MDLNLIISIASGAILFVIMLFISTKINGKKKELKEQLNRLNDKFGGVVDVDSEIKKLITQRDSLSQASIKLDGEISDKNKKLSAIRSEHQTKLESILSQIKIYQSDINNIEVGLHDPIFDYDTSEKFKTQLMDNKSRQKEMVKNGTACKGHREWSVEGSAAKGRAMIAKNVKMSLRAFNGESDALIAKVKWNNVESFAKRIFASYDAINKFNDKLHIVIDRKYLQLKIDELHLTYEKEVKIQEEKERAKEIANTIREEEKAIKEIEKARKDAEIEEKRYSELLKKAREEADIATGSQLDKLNSQIELLARKLEEANGNKERAISRAQQTRSGHVYVISNIGSFGENIYKVGLTRRLIPMDRVKELSGAAVPFKFDLHAMIYSEDAPAMETAIHKALDSKRVNKVNSRKEYFNTDLSEIESIVKEMGSDVEFIKLPEAQEYRETLLKI